jgi:hypothetical protein
MLAKPIVPKVNQNSNETPCAGCGQPAPLKTWDGPLCETCYGERRAKAPSLEARAFVVAFCPDNPQQNITQLWSLKASEAIQTLIEFRSAVHRWQAAGRVDSAEFVAEVQRLDDAGLAEWLDELIGLATVASVGGEL